MKTTNPVYAIIAVRTAQLSLVALLLHGLFHWPLTGPHALGLVFTPLLCVYFVFVFVAPWSWGMPILTRLPTREKVVALTFDDGPSPETTPGVLDALRAHDVQATFFVLGEAVERHPDLLRRIVAEGHSVGLHGHTHRPWTLASGQDTDCKIRRASQAVRNVFPELPAPCLLRPPHGFKTLTLPWVVRRNGCRLVAWSLNPQDYRASVPDLLAKTLLSRLHPGAIVLLHDGPDNAVTAAALPSILAGLAAQGYRGIRLLPQEALQDSGAVSRVGE